VCWVPARFIPCTNIVFWLIKAVIISSIVCVFYYIRYRRAPEFANIKNKAAGLSRKITGKFRK
jgi:NADH:ubiquinone oxidoreductase subunit 2 (subunit N)